MKEYFDAVLKGITVNKVVLKWSAIALLVSFITMGLPGAGQAFDNVFAAAKAAELEKLEIVYINIAFSGLGELREVDDTYINLFHEGKRPSKIIYQAAALSFFERRGNKNSSDSC